MDYEKLRSEYGRVIGIEESLAGIKGGLYDGFIANDYNDAVSTIAQISGENLDKFKIPGDQYSTYSSNNRPCVYGGTISKIKQLISYLRYKYNLDEKILEIGSLINAIENKELKDRCLDLLKASGKFDRVINQATQVLEHVIRQKSGITDKEGVKLINHVFKDTATDSILVIEEDPEEHEGFGHICRGLMLGFRNPTHHKLSDKFTREDALKFCGFIDVLLKIIDSAKKNDK